MGAITNAQLNAIKTAIDNNLPDYRAPDQAKTGSTESGNFPVHVRDMVKAILDSLQPFFEDIPAAPDISGIATNAQAISTNAAAILALQGEVRNVPDWQANTTYARGDLLKRGAGANTKFYGVHTGFTSGSTFSNTNLIDFTAVGSGGTTLDANGLLALLTEGTDIGIRIDPNDAAKVEVRYTGTGGGTQYDTPSIAGFRMTGLDIQDGNAAGDVQISYHVTHPENIRGNTQGGSANNNLGIEQSTDGNTWTSITSQVTQNIPKGSVDVTITLPATNIAAGSSVYYRLFAYTNQATPAKITSNELQFTRPRAHERAYWGHQNSNSFTSSFDFADADGSADVQNSGSQFQTTVNGVPNQDWYYVITPSNRHLVSAIGQLGRDELPGWSHSDFTVSGQTYRAYFIQNESGFPQNRANVCTTE